MSPDPAPLARMEAAAKAAGGVCPGRWAVADGAPGVVEALGPAVALGVAYECEQSSAAHIAAWDPTNAGKVAEALRTAGSVLVWAAGKGREFAHGPDPDICWCAGCEAERALAVIRALVDLTEPETET